MRFEFVHAEKARYCPFTVEEVETVSQSLSPSQEKLYDLALVFRAWQVSRATVYRRRVREATEASPVCRKRGPKIATSDEELLAHIRPDLSTTQWVGEGHRKVWARLRLLKGVRTSMRRVLRLMREANILAPRQARHILDPQSHDGTIIHEHPNTLHPNV